MHLKASWTTPKARIGADTYEAKLDLPDEVTESAVLVLRILVPTSPSISVRAGWNDLVYNGTYYNSASNQVSSFNNVKADKNFFRAPQFPSPPTAPYFVELMLQTNPDGLIQETK